MFQCGCFEVLDETIMSHGCEREVPPIRGGVGYMDNGYGGDYGGLGQLIP